VTTRTGGRPGDRRIRIELVKPREFEVAQRKPVRRPPPPALVLILGFLGLIAVGTALLALPLSSADGRSAPLLVALFTATSAVCVTGLVVVDTAAFWSPFGHAVILALIQVGGFGFMTGSTLLLFLLVGRRTGLRDRIMVQETSSAGRSSWRSRSPPVVASRCRRHGWACSTRSRPSTTPVST
jgi:hypothetical protein